MSVEQLDIPIGVDLTPFRNAMARVRAQVLSVPKVRVDHSGEIDALKTASQRVTSEAKTATQAVAKISGASSFRELSASAHKTWRAMSSVSTELTITQKKMARVGIAASILTGNFGFLERQAVSLGASVSTHFVAMARAVGLVQRAFSGVAAVASATSTVFGAAGAAMTTVLIHASAVLKVMSVGLIIWEGAMIAATGVVNVFKAALWVVITPLKIMTSAFVSLAKFVWAMIAPFARLAASIYGFWIQMKATGLAIKWITQLFGLLSPKMKAIVASMFTLGLAARALGPVMRLLGPAAAVATAGLKLLALPIVALVNPSVAGAMALGMLKNGIRSVGRMALGAIGAMRAFTVSVGRAAVSVTRRLAGGALRMASAALKTFATVAVAATGWGIKLAADAEQAEIAFTTMLGSASGAKAVLSELEQFAASTPFQLKDLRDGAKQLLNAGVSADQLTSKLTILGDIAAGTGKPINDFVRIFSKVKSTGRVSLETLNQLAERGVPIYSTLQSQLGKSRSEMLKMISQGKVGFSDLNSALNATATGSGVFAGGMKAQSQSISGLFSTLKDNVGLAMRELGIEVMSAFNFKGMLARGIELFQSLKSGIASARPLFVALGREAKALFNAVAEVASVAFNGITSMLGLTSASFMRSFVEMAAVGTFAFKSWPDIAELAFLKLDLWLVQAGSAFGHLFTGVMPALFTWFGNNWKSLFSDAGNIYMTFFRNLHANIYAVMESIWEYIESGGTKSLKVAWTPLLDGFKATLSEVPDIPPRAISALEKQLKAQSDNLGKALSTGLADEIASNLKMLDEFKSQKVEMPSLDGIRAQTDQPIESDTAPKSNSSKVIESLDRGTEGALRAINAANRDRTADKQLTEAKKTNKHLAAIAKKEPIAFAVAGGVS